MLRVQNIGENRLVVIVIHPNVDESPIRTEGLNRIIFGEGLRSPGIFRGMHQEKEGGIPGSCAGAGTQRLFAKYLHRRYRFSRKEAGGEYSLSIEREDGEPYPETLAAEIIHKLSAY